MKLEWRGVFIRFVNEVAGLAEAMNHHPFIAIDYKKVTLRITSWKAGRLTELDFVSAAEYDRVHKGIAGK